MTQEDTRYRLYRTLIERYRTYIARQQHENGVPQVRNRRGFGHLRRLPSKRWQASYLGPDMLRYQAPATFETKIDGEEWLAAERKLVADHAWLPPAQCNRRELTSEMPFRVGGLGLSQVPISQHGRASRRYGTLKRPPSSVDRGLVRTAAVTRRHQRARQRTSGTSSAALMVPMFGSGPSELMR